MTITVPPKPKRKFGPPSSFHPAVLDHILWCGEQGMGLLEMAAEIGVNHETLKKWEKDIPEFAEAFAEAKARSQAWWEAKGRQHTFEGEINATMYIFQMKNRFRKDWNDRQLIGSDPDNPIPTTISVNFAKAPPAKDD